MAGTVTSQLERGYIPVGFVSPAQARHTIYGWDRHQSAGEGIYPCRICVSNTGRARPCGAGRCARTRVYYKSSFWKASGRVVTGVTVTVKPGSVVIGVTVTPGRVVTGVTVMVTSGSSHRSHGHGHVWQGSHRSHSHNDGSLSPSRGRGGAAQLNDAPAVSTSDGHWQGPPSNVVRPHRFPALPFIFHLCVCVSETKKKKKKKKKNLKTGNLSLFLRIMLKKTLQTKRPSLHSYTWVTRW